MLTITVGTGLARPYGKRRDIASPAEYAAALRSLPSGVEAWWSPHVWRADYRLSESWESASAVAIDIDYEIKDATPPKNIVEALVYLAHSGTLPGSVFHLTPHGARVVFVLPAQCIDREIYRAIAVRCGSNVTEALRAADLNNDYRVDEPLLQDLGRLFFAPNALAKGIQRRADVRALFPVLDLPELTP